MPTYDYICTSCGNAWELEQRIVEDPIKVCPACGASTAKRQISAGAGFILKGGGWYADLYGSSKPSTSDSKADDKGTKAEPKAEPKADDSKGGGDAKKSDAKGDGGTKTETKPAGSGDKKPTSTGGGDKAA